MRLVLLVAVPSICGLLSLLVRSLRVSLALLLAVALAHLGLTVSLWTSGFSEKVGIFLELDALGRLFLTTTSVVFFATALYTIPYLRNGTHDKQARPLDFVPCLLGLLAAMTLVTITQHLALMWAAVEAATLASAPLIYFYKRKTALEAAWKYLLLCSVGIALALLGVFFLSTAASAAPGDIVVLRMADLLAIAPQMSLPWFKAAFVLALVGYGTKLGLAPLHTWMPDTYSQAPSPVSALLSGALLNCTFLAILRFYQISVATGHPAFAQTLLLLLGFLSLGVALALLLGQRDYKRLLAYSSLENVGILTIGVGLGGEAVYGTLLHALNHSFAKAGLFFLAGNVLRAYGTTTAGEVRGVLQRLPLSGVLFAALLLAIGGTPPLGPFWSELVILQAAFVGPHVWLGALFALSLAVAFLGMAGVLFPMLQTPAHGAANSARPERLLEVAPPLVMAGLVLVLGLYIPPLLDQALRQAASSLGG